MASYRFCRTDDIPLLAEAHSVCFAVHFPGMPPMSAEDFKRQVRRIDLWTSSSMVASEGRDPIGVLLATKRDDEMLIWRIGIKPGRERQGHGRHLLASLSAKLAILGPPRMLAEVPADRRAVLAFFEACGYQRETEYTDFLLRSPRPEPPSDLPFPVTVDELVANGALDIAAPRCWERSRATLINRRDEIGGLAVASEERIEAWLLFEKSPPGDRRGVLGFGCADKTRAGLWLGLLFRQYAAQDRSPVRIPRVDPREIPFELLRSWGFEPGAVTVGYAARPVAA